MIQYVLLYRKLKLPDYIMETSNSSILLILGCSFAQSSQTLNIIFKASAQGASNVISCINKKMYLYYNYGHIYIYNVHLHSSIDRNKTPVINAYIAKLD